MYISLKNHYDIIVRYEISGRRKGVLLSLCHSMGDKMVGVGGDKQKEFGAIKKNL